MLTDLKAKRAETRPEDAKVSAANNTNVFRLLPCRFCLLDLGETETNGVKGKGTVTKQFLKIPSFFDKKKKASNDNKNNNKKT